MEKGAVIDKTKKYRYLLWRKWDNKMPKSTFIMLNPSTADASEDDPTIRKCIQFAQKWGCGAIDVVNLFAYRATDFQKLKVVSDPVGEENDDYIVKSVNNASYVVAAWGDHGGYLLRHYSVIRLISALTDINCLGTTSFGHPKHPLFLNLTTPLQPYWSQYP